MAFIFILHLDRPVDCETALEHKQDRLCGLAGMLGCVFIDGSGSWPAFWYCH